MVKQWWLYNTMYSCKSSLTLVRANKHAREQEREKTGNGYQYKRAFNLSARAMKNSLCPEPPTWWSWSIGFTLCIHTFPSFISHQTRIFSCKILTLKLKTVWCETHFFDMDAEKVRFSSWLASLTSTQIQVFRSRFFHIAQFGKCNTEYKTCLKSKSF